MMVIKPKFPTASHATEMAKLIVDGIGLMSLADMSPEGKSKAASETFRSWIGDNTELLNKVMAQVASYKPKRKTGGFEQLREAVKYSLTSKESMDVIAQKFGVERTSLQSMIFRMKKSGVELPDRPSGIGILATDKVEQMSKNPETGMLGYSQQVRDSIRMMNSTGQSQRQNAIHHGVSRETVRRILNEPQKARDYRPERTDPTEPYGGPHA
jgi:transposase